MLADEFEEEVVFYTADELSKVDVPNPSATVQKHVGTPSVCEAAAILGSNNGKLLISKIKGKNWTAALAIDRRYLRSTVFSGKTAENKGNATVLSGSAAEEKGHIEIVGAGPGDPDLISVRGRKMLERADLIERRRQGQDKPARIYVKRFQRSDFPTSGGSVSHR